MLTIIIIYINAFMNTEIKTTLRLIK